MNPKIVIGAIMVLFIGFFLTQVGSVAKWRASGLANQANEKVLGGDPLAAAQLADSALQLDPECSSAHLVLGEVAARKGHYEEAIRRYERASRLDRKNPVAALGYATFLERTGAYTEAAGAYEDLILKFKGTKEAGVAELRLRGLPKSARS